MESITTVSQLINLWPTRADLASDIHAVLRAEQVQDVSVTKHRVQKWAEKESVPSKYHHLILQAAVRRGLAVTADLIVAVHAPKRSAA